MYTNVHLNVFDVHQFKNKNVYIKMKLAQVWFFSECGWLTYHKVEASSIPPLVFENLL